MLKSNEPVASGYVAMEWRNLLLFWQLEVERLDAEIKKQAGK